MNKNETPNEGAARPAVPSTDWLEEAKAALRHAQRAYDMMPKGQDRHYILIGRNYIQSALDVDAKRRASSNGELTHGAK